MTYQDNAANQSPIKVQCHAWQDDLDKWARDNLPSESAGCISSWSDHIAQFIVSRLNAQATHQQKPIARITKDSKGNDR